MKNFVQPGNYGLMVIAPANVVSGQLVIVHAIVGVAATDAVAGAQVEIACEGVYDLAKVPADVLTVGAVAEVNTSGLITSASTGLTGGIGWVVQAAAAGSATARVRLCPSVAGSPTVLEAEHQKQQPPKHGR